MGIKFPTPWKTLITKFPPPWDGKGVKCQGYARGGGGVGDVEASIWPEKIHMLTLTCPKVFTCMWIISHTGDSIYILCMWNLKFTCMTKLFHMCENISRVIKSSHMSQTIFTYITKFHMYVKKFTCMWNADVVNLYFCQHWFHMVTFFNTLFTWFSHT